MQSTFGYHVFCGPSRVGGKGVFLECGKDGIDCGNLVALYPGTLYLQRQPILLQSIRNPFIFRCLDGIILDGHNKGISKVIFK